MVETIKGSLDLLAIGETLVDFISEETSDSLLDALVFRKFLGGSPANIAVNVAKLGGRSAVISKTGIGTFGQFLKAELGRHGVGTEYLIMDHRVHTSIIFVARTSGTPDFEASRDGDYKLAPKEIDPEAIDRARIIHASTFALSREPCRSAVRRAFELARDGGKTISLDPNYSPVIWPDRRQALQVLGDLLPLADLTKPSLDDARRLFGPGERAKDYVARYHSLGARLVVLTMGADGILISEGRELTHIPARPVQVRDVTGAGDAFWAGFLVAYLDGHPPDRCALFAREVVELKLSTVGPLPDTIDRADITARLEMLP